MRTKLYALGRLYVIACSAILIGACATPQTRLYSGEAVPRDQLAILKVASVLPFGARPILHAVDGQKIKRSWWDATAEVELMPGRHRALVGYTQNTIGGVRFSTHDYIIEFDAEAGHTYEIRATFNSEGGDRRWDAEIVDVKSGAKFLPL